MHNLAKSLKPKAESKFKTPSVYGSFFHRLQIGKRFLDDLSVARFILGMRDGGNVLFGIECVAVGPDFEGNTSFTQGGPSIDHEKRGEVHPHLVAHLIQISFGFIVKAQAYRNHWLYLLKMHDEINDLNDFCFIFN